ncbi:MAG: xanthine dehydrogenase family protein [Rhodobacteraceae bacterium]|nr:xanthine dehydrogenase family protein [Paracoccaceae bacterium]
MEKFGKSQPTRRIEDPRFLTGAGRYVDDIAPREALFAYFFRAPVAHSVIDTLDVAQARAADGVRLVLTVQDLDAAGIDTDVSEPSLVLDNRDGTKGAAPKRPALARERVRHVGEPVVAIIADSLNQARDAAESIVFESTDLPVHLDLAPGSGAPVHSEAPDNRAFDWETGDAAKVEQIFASAAHVVTMEIGDNRVIANPMEPRGCYAQWQDGRLHLCVNGQGVWPTKTHLSKALGLPPEQLRITNPDVGGGFGMKAMHYPENLVVAAAARMLGRPVRWMSERGEAMLSDNAGRDLVSLAEMAFDADLRALAYRVRSRANLGAYNSTFGQAIQTTLFARVLTGVYDVQDAHLQVDGFYTNTTQTDAYRGAGRPEAIYALERLMDQAARALNVDSWELRRRNFIAKTAFPYTSATGALYDVGDFHRVLARAEGLCDRAGFAARKAASARAGKLRGMGLCYYIECILGDPTETAKITFDAEDRVSIYVGTQSNGQGHETVYAQFLSDQTGIPADRIRVVQGDSDLIATGGGTGGSRSVTVQNTATLATVAKMTEAFRGYLAEKMEVPKAEVIFDDERFRAEGSNLTPTMLEVAAMARADGRDDLLTGEAKTTLPGQSFPNGAHVAEVEIDPQTGAVRLERYTVVDDFGNMINPMLVEGQVHGGILQGVGQALCERTVFDADGQLLSASFMDYAMPRADDVPMFTFATEPVPSTANAIGMKGCGEAGTVGSMGAMANAVQDALWDAGVKRADMPFTPHRVWQMLQDAQQHT